LTDRRRTKLRLHHWPPAEIMITEKLIVKRTSPKAPESRNSNRLRLPFTER
jgi:hypothetical protein